MKLLKQHIFSHASLPQEIKIAPLLASLFLVVGCSTKPIVVDKKMIEDTTCSEQPYLQRDLSDKSAYKQKGMMYVTADGKTCRY